MCTADDAGSKRMPPTQDKAARDSWDGSEDPLPQRRTRRSRKVVISESPDAYKPEDESASDESSVVLSEGDLDDLDSSFETKKKPKITKITTDAKIAKIAQSAKPTTKTNNTLFV